jgi:hypothetical protein
MTSAEVDAILSDKTLPNEPAKLGGKYRGSQPYVDPAQARERRAAMSAALAQGASRDAIIATFTAKYNMSESAIESLRKEVVQIWAEEDREQLSISRGAARRRLMGHIHSAAKDRRWTAVAALEKTLSDIEGTVAPEPVNADDEDDVTRTMKVVMEQLGAMDAAQVRILIDRERIAIEAQRGDVEDLRPKAILSGKMGE